MAPQRDFDDDDFDDGYDDDYGEEEEMSAEDQAAMSNGTAEVKKVLGADASKVTVKQIQDALWNSWYDVDKSVASLRKAYITPAPKPAPKKPTQGMSAAFLFTAGLDIGGENSGGTSGADPWHFGSMDDTTSITAPTPSPILSQLPITRSSFDFSDMPWLNVPQHRQTVFVAPHRPRGGLLGGGDGTPKMSKLQALAAARKKKTEEKKTQETSQTTKQLQGLSISESNRKENERPVSPSSKRQKLSTEAPPSTAKAATTVRPSTLDGNAEEVDTPQQEMQLGPDSRPPSHHLDGFTSRRDEVHIDTETAAPSAFAATLFGSAPESSRTHRRDVYAMPYTSSSSFSASAFAKPSPDDIVFAAQAKAGKKPAEPAKTAKKPPKGKDATTQESSVTSGVANLKVNDIPPPKSKGLDVVKEFENSNAKRSVSFVVVGHVDAGKSTLMGRLLVDMKFVEERTVDKYRRLAEKSGKQSFALAWVMDQRTEERDRGVTIDIATNHFETPTTLFTILDAPGHRDFVPNMIAGASQADFAILVIDANTGAYEKGLKGQTREHVLLLRSLGVQRLVIAVNKLDMVGWSQERFDEISQEVTGFLTGLGFQSKYFSFVPISGLSGVNIAQKIETPEASWYKGPSLIEALEASEPTATRALKKPFRMGISEVFRSQQGTTTLAGRVDSGTFQLGDVVFVQPSGETAYVKSIMADNVAQDWAVAGQNITVALTDIDPIHIRVGDILCHTTDPIDCVDTFTMKAMAFEHLMPMPVDLHRGRLHAAGQILSIAATLDKATGEVLKKKPKVVQPGAVARVSIKLNAKVPLEKGQRVVIRSQGETIAAGLLE